MDDLSALLAQWSEGFAARNNDALAALYCEDALLYGSSPELVSGREAIRGYFQALPQSGALGAEFSNLVMRQTSPSTASVGAAVTFTMDDFTMPMRITLGLVRCGAAWSIGLHHASPVQGIASEEVGPRDDRLESHY